MAKEGYTAVYLLLTLTQLVTCVSVSFKPSLVFSLCRQHLLEEKSLFWNVLELIIFLCSLFLPFQSCFNMLIICNVLYIIYQITTSNYLNFGMNDIKLLTHARF